MLYSHDSFSTSLPTPLVFFFKHFDCEIFTKTAESPNIRSQDRKTVPQAIHFYSLLPDFQDFFLMWKVLHGILSFPPLPPPPPLIHFLPPETNAP